MSLSDRSLQDLADRFDYSPAALIVFDAGGTIVAANHSAATLFKQTVSDLQTKSFSDFLTPEDRIAFHDHLHRTLETDRRETVELQVTTRSGDFWSRLDSRRKPERIGQGLCYTAITDISDRKRIQDDLILARENAVSANRAKNAFLANVSHEIRTPMSGIIAMSELALQTSLTKEQQGYIGVIHSSARSLLTLVDDILDVSKIEADHIAMEKRSFRLGEMVSAVHAMFHPNAARKGVDLVAEIPEGVSERLKGDRNRIRQVLINLVSNAIRFTDAGSVTIRVAEGELSDFLREVTFEVADTGPGIEPSEQRRIYEMFRQAKEDAAIRYEGKRLGLAISRKLARLMGGQLYFETSPGGSRFFFSVPLEISDDEDESPAEIDHDRENAPPPGGGRRILLAEDNSLNILVIRTVLEKAGYEVTAVRNGEEAIAMLEQAQFDLVLMDISMPGMDGLTATRTIRSRSSTEGFDPKIPVIAISAHSMKGDRERFLEAGMNDYISKPFVRDTVMDVIRRNLRQKDAHDPA